MLTKVLSVDVCECCQIAIAIDEHGTEHEVGLFNPRCPRCYIFLDPLNYNYVNQECSRCEVMRGD